MVFPLSPTYASAITVRLPEYDGFWNNTITSPVYSGIRFGSDGKIYRATPDGAWQWTGQSWLVSGAASGFYLVRTVLSGSALGTDDGTLQQMNADLDYVISTTEIRKTTDIEFSISDDASGSPILVTRTYQLDAQREFSPDQGEPFQPPFWKSSES